MRGAVCPLHTTIPCALLPSHARCAARGCTATSGLGRRMAPCANTQWRTLLIHTETLVSRYTFYKPSDVTRLWMKWSPCPTGNVCSLQALESSHRSTVHANNATCPLPSQPRLQTHIAVRCCRKIHCSQPGHKAPSNWSLRAEALGEFTTFTPTMLAVK